MSNNKLQAFSPNGDRILKTLEIGVGSHSVRYFFLHEGRLTPEFGDDHDDGDCPYTASYNGEPVYLDESGNSWPAEALTLKTPDGTVVRDGQAVKKLPDLNVARASELSLKAEILCGGAHNLTEQDWVDTVNRQFWNDASQVIHLEGFIREMGLMPALAAYAKRAAAEENGEESAVEG